MHGAEEWTWTVVMPSRSQVVARQLQEAKELGPRRALHFQPPGWPHPLTAVLPLPAAPSAAAEDALQPRRKELHRRLSAPCAL